jgi:hypothetical protein
MASMEGMVDEAVTSGWAAGEMKGQAAQEVVIVGLREIIARLNAEAQVCPPVLPGDVYAHMTGRCTYYRETQPRIPHQCYGHGAGARRRHASRCCSRPIPWPSGPCGGIPPEAEGGVLLRGRLGAGVNQIRPCPRKIGSVMPNNQRAAPHLAHPEG